MVTEQAQGSPHSMIEVIDEKTNLQKLLVVPLENLAFCSTLLDIFRSTPDSRSTPVGNLPLQLMCGHGQPQSGREWHALDFP